MLMQLDIAGHVMHLVTSAPVLVDISVLDVPSQGETTLYMHMAVALLNEIVLYMHISSFSTRRNFITCIFHG